MCCTVHGCVSEHGAVFLIFLKLQQSGYQWLLMSACCNLNTERRASESLCSHSNKISTFFDNDGLNSADRIYSFLHYPKIIINI